MRSLPTCCLCILVLGVYLNTIMGTFHISPKLSSGQIIMIIIQQCAAWTELIVCYHEVYFVCSYLQYRGNWIVCFTRDLQHFSTLGISRELDSTHLNSQHALRKESTAFLDFRKMCGCLNQHGYPLVSGTKLLWLRYNFSYQFCVHVQFFCCSCIIPTLYKYI